MGEERTTIRSHSHTRAFRCNCRYAVRGLGRGRRSGAQPSLAAVQAAVASHVLHRQALALLVTYTYVCYTCDNVVSGSDGQKLYILKAFHFCYYFTKKLLLTDLYFTNKTEKD